MSCGVEENTSSLLAMLRLMGWFEVCLRNVCYIILVVMQMVLRYITK
jgi:hypothetical protein